MFACTSRRIRFLSTIRYSSSSGSFGRFTQHVRRRCRQRVALRVGGVDLQRDLLRNPFISLVDVLFQLFLRLATPGPLHDRVHQPAELVPDFRREDVARLRVGSRRADFRAERLLRGFDFSGIIGFLDRQRILGGGLVNSHVRVDSLLEVGEDERVRVRVVLCGLLPCGIRNLRFGRLRRGLLLRGSWGGAKRARAKQPRRTSG